MEEYRTIKEYAADEFVERKSRFIGHIAPVKTEAEALAFIEKVSKENRTATHNVWAFRLRGGLSRCSDNGEPQGTAGVPVLDVLQKEEIVDACIVVTRYFGGILLGTGGLVRAYSHGAKLALDAAAVLQMAPCAELQVICDYSLYSRLTYLLPDYHVQVKESDFGADITLSLLIRLDRLKEFSKALTELSNGRVAPQKVREFFSDMK